MYFQCIAVKQLNSVQNNKILNQILIFYRYRKFRKNIWFRKLSIMKKTLVTENFPNRISFRITVLQSGCDLQGVPKQRARKKICSPPGNQ